MVGVGIPSCLMTITDTIAALALAVAMVAADGRSRTEPRTPGPQTAQVRRRQDDLSAAGDHIQADRLTLVDNPSTRSFACSRTPLARQLAARSIKLKLLSQAFHITS